MFEGDIELTDHDHVNTMNTGDVDGPIGNIVRRNAARSRQGLWQTRVIPYEIDSAISGKLLQRPLYESHLLCRSMKALRILVGEKRCPLAKGRLFS